ncbi:DUF86 domain-containing protein [Galbitalea sp. SE-J8]|uniref:HepT-like ribonuclease domain-containing protein n=1 Tax=Galbitalea sp. SE-J8 TaxID=3054952 RepID=UPI00259CB4A6|nr:HepT-like ribonuclease domain-containing protein [Galbitalea sp. SE-J8]MDM4764320.1 DUF86 domain-containing protein [Galbitalea sp. SE-J8]
MSDEGRFRARPSADPASAPPKWDVERDIVAELVDLARDASEIVALGRDAFLGDGGRLLRHAADGIVMNVQELCDRLPETYRETHPEVPWNDIRGMRNRLGHNYRATDHRLVWRVLDVSIPDLIASLTR